MEDHTWDDFEAKLRVVDPDRDGTFHVDSSEREEPTALCGWTGEVKTVAVEGFRF